MPLAKNGDDHGVQSSKPSRPQDTEDQELEYVSRLTRGRSSATIRRLYAKAACAVSWQKHKQERENKVAQAVQTELNEYVRDPTDECPFRCQDVSTYMRMNRHREANLIALRVSEHTYQNYLAQTAVVEDKMRAVMVAIIEKQQRLLVSFEFSFHINLRSLAIVVHGGAKAPKGDSSRSRS